MKPKDSFFLDLSDQGDAPTPVAKKTAEAKPVKATKTPETKPQAPAKPLTATKAPEAKPQKPAKALKAAKTPEKKPQAAPKPDKAKAEGKSNNPFTGILGALKPKQTKLVDAEPAQVEVTNQPTSTTTADVNTSVSNDEEPVDANTTAPADSGTSELLAAGIAHTATLHSLQQLELEIEMLVPGSSSALRRTRLSVKDKLDRQLELIVPGIIPVTFAEKNLKAGNTIRRRPRRPGAGLKGFKDMASDLYRA